MSTSHVLLGLLAGGPKHGYDLKRAHDTHLPAAKPMPFGQVYATLGRLARDGLVTEAGTDRAGGPERTSYELTDAGHAAIEGWLATVEPPAPYVSSVLFSKIVVAVLTSGHDAAREYLIRQRSAHVTRLREWTAVKTDPAAGPGDLIAADYAIAHLDADLRWLDTTLARVADLKGANP